ACGRAVPCRSRPRTLRDGVADEYHFPWREHHTRRRATNRRGTAGFPAHGTADIRGGGADRRGGTAPLAHRAELLRVGSGPADGPVGARCRGAGERHRRGRPVGTVVARAVVSPRVHRRGAGGFATVHREHPLPRPAGTGPGPTRLQTPS